MYGAEATMDAGAEIVVDDTHELPAATISADGAAHSADGNFGQSAQVSVVVLLCMIAGAYFLLMPRRRQRAGTVPLRVSPSGRMSLMLVQSRKHPEYWTFPAGGVELGERVEAAATRETREEAGLVGTLGRRICRATDSKNATTMFALYVEAELETWDECDSRQRRWFDLGVPSSPMAEQYFTAVRQKLSPKPAQQQILQACERYRVELANEGELREASWGRPPRRKLSPSKQ